MDPLFRSREYSNPSLPTMNRPSASPHSGSNPSPHSGPADGKGYSRYNGGFGHNSGQGSAAGQGLDRMLQSPRDIDFRGSDSSYLDVRNGNGRGRRDNDREDHNDYGSSDRGNDGGRNSRQAPPVFPSTGPTAKRGSKACAACRKGKNRCEGDPSGTNRSCRRCLMNGIPCVFEKPADKKDGRGRGVSMTSGGDAVGDVVNDGRVMNLERSVENLAHGQNEIHSALNQILAMLPRQNSLPTPTSMSSYAAENGTINPSIPNIFHNSASPPNIYGNASLDSHNLSQIQVQDGMFPPPRAISPDNTARGRLSEGGGMRNVNDKKIWPKLPGFAPPDHRFGTYGIIPLESMPPSPNYSHRSSRSSSPHSVASDAGLPRNSLTAPIQALQTLANAADQATAVAAGTGVDEKESDAIVEEMMLLDQKIEIEGDNSRKRKKVNFDPKGIHLRVKKKSKPEPTPRNAFPDVVTKGLVMESEARELWDIFFSGCHYFLPLFDKKYDMYETFIERTPFSTNGLLAVAAKIRAGNGQLGNTFHRCLEEAQGIARSTLFGPCVRKEAVMATLILSVWSQNGWLPCGHALRMGLDLNIHRALDKLAESGEERTEVEERDLVVSARIWMNCYMNDHLISLGTGKPLLLRDDASVKKARILLSHPMASETDMRLIAGVELVNLRIRVVDHLTPLHGKVDSQTISFVKRMFSDLQDWYHEWYAIHRQRYDEESVLVKLLEAELVYAQLWTVCVALRGCEWDKLPLDQRELAFQAKDAAMRCLEIFLRSQNFRSHLKYATHDQLVSVAFAAVFLLKIAIIYPQQTNLHLLISQVSELAHLLSSECFAERYALTLRLMLSNFRRKTGAVSTMPGTPRMTAIGGPGFNGHLPTFGTNGVGELDGGLQSLLSLPQTQDMEGFGDGNGMMVNGNNGALGNGDWYLGDDGLEGFTWPEEFSPGNLPDWLRDGNVTDLGLPLDGSDSLFLPLELANMFLPSGTTSNGSHRFTLPDSADVGAEAW